MTISYLPGHEPDEPVGDAVCYQVADAGVLVDISTNGDIDVHGKSVTVGRYQMTVEVARRIAAEIVMLADHLDTWTAAGDAG